MSLNHIESCLFDRYHCNGLQLQQQSKPASDHGVENASESPPSSLSQLSPELIILMFKSVNTFSTASSLARTSAKFQTIWKLNIASISLAILPRIVPFLAEALELIDSTITKTSAHSTGRRTYEEIVHLIHLLVDNRNLAAVNLAMHNRLVQHKVSADPHSVYFRAYYQAMTLRNRTKVSLELDSTAELPSQYLASLSMLEFKQLKEVMWYYEGIAETRRQWSIHLYLGLRRPEQSIMDQGYFTLLEMTSLSRQLNKIPGVWKKISLDGHPGSNENVSWLRPESCKKNCAGASKLRLKELLPLLEDSVEGKADKYRLY